VMTAVKLTVAGGMYDSGQPTAGQIAAAPGVSCATVYPSHASAAQANGAIPTVSASGPIEPIAQSGVA
jgi:hypothetical protein